MFSPELRAVQVEFSPASIEAEDTFPVFRQWDQSFCGFVHTMVTLITSEMLYFKKQALAWGINLKQAVHYTYGKKSFRLCMKMLMLLIS